MPPASHYLRTERDGNVAAIVLVHGLSGDPSGTWGRLPDLLMQDAQLAHCDVVSWRYPTSLMPPGLLGLPLRVPLVGRRMPIISEVSGALRSDLVNDQIAGSYADLVLVGHSMGGLVIVEMILDALEHLTDPRSAELLRRIRRVVLYSTPTRGVELPGIVKAHPQVRSLDANSEFIDRIARQWSRAQTAAPTRDEAGRPPVTAIWGLEDGAVSRDSALALGDERETAPGQHTEVCKPLSRADTSFELLKSAVVRSTIPTLIADSPALLRANLSIVREARRVLYAVGSRSRDPEYLAAIEEALQRHPQLVYHRVLVGPLRRDELKQHLSRVLGIRDPAARVQGQKTVYIGQYTDTAEQPEVFLVGNEVRCLVTIPALTSGVGDYSSGLAVTGARHVDAYERLVKTLYAAGEPKESAPAIAALPVVSTHGS